MSRTKRTAFPRWVIAATIASCFAVVTLGILATQMFAKEIAIYREQLQRKSWAESKIGPMLNSGAYPIRSTELTASDSDTLRQWESVGAQVSNPYIKAQKMVLAEETPAILTTLSHDDSVFDPNVVWSRYPMGLAEFAKSNRLLLDTIYELASKPIDDPLLVSRLNSGTMFRIHQLVLWDMANSVASKDKELFAKGINAYHWSMEYLSGYNPNQATYFCLLHRGLDEKLIDSKMAANSLERYTKNVSLILDQRQSLLGDLETRRAFYYTSFGKQFMEGWTLPSLREAIFESYFFRNNLGTNPSVEDHQFLEAIQYFTVAIRVALLEAIEEKQGQLRVPQDVLAKLRMPSELESVLAMKLDGSYSPASLFEYSEKLPGVGELKFDLPRDISSGPFPIRTTYQIENPSAN